VSNQTADNQLTLGQCLGTRAAALAIQEEFMFENSCNVFTFVAKHYGNRYLCLW